MTFSVQYSKKNMGSGYARVHHLGYTLAPWCVSTN